jgi:acyl-CoA hydrolase/GNAT superfamily N-acetyltransferase
MSPSFPIDTPQQFFYTFNKNLFQYFQGNMSNKSYSLPWNKRIVSPDEVLKRIKPGSSIFLGTGLAEPRTLVKALTYSNATNLTDLELIQLISIGDAVSMEKKYSGHLRLKTFFGGLSANKAITAGLVDLIPSRFSAIPRLFESGRIRIDVAFIQITPPDHEGFCSLGLAVDVARQAIEKADLVVGEINHYIPRTNGDTFVHIDDFDLLVEGTVPPLYFPHREVNDIFMKIGENVASVINDGSCLAFGVGPLYESLSKHLVKKKDLGIHSPFVTDAVMDLVKSGAVSNKYKSIFKNKCSVSYAVGSEGLIKWLDKNPIIEFQGIDVVADPTKILTIDNFICVLPARKVDLTGEVSFHSGKGFISAGPAEALEFLRGATFSKGGRIIFALPSRNLAQKPNIILSVYDHPNYFSIVKESLDLVVTEYGITSLKGRTIRERAFALIDIAHPDDRAELVRQAKEDHILYSGQVYFEESGRLYPDHLTHSKIVKEGLNIQFRAIKPSDVDEMRRFFYRLPDESKYLRYFAPIDAMPHEEMQEYVTVDHRHIISIVAIVGDPQDESIIAEARYIRWPDRSFADVAFAVDEKYRRIGIGSYLYQMLLDIAKKNGLEGFNATVLADNAPMLKVFQKNAPYPINAVLSGDKYDLSMPFYSDKTGYNPGQTVYPKPDTMHMEKDDSSNNV